LLDAGEAAQAIDPLLESALELIRQLRFEETAVALRAWERAMNAAAVPPSDPRWGRGWIGKICVERAAGNFEATDRWTTRAVAAAREHGWPCLPIALQYVGNAHLRRQQFEQAAAVYRECVALLEPEGREATMLAYLAAAVSRTDRSAAEQLYARAAIAAERKGDERASSDVHALMSIHYIRTMQWERAEAAIRKALDICQGIWTMSRHHTHFMFLANALMGQNRLDEAEPHYRAIPPTTPQYPNAQMGLGMVQYARGNLTEARNCFERSLSAATIAGRTGGLHALHAALLPCHAANEDWEAFDTCLAGAAGMSSSRENVEVLVRDAAETAERLGQSERAAAARTLSDSMAQLPRT